MNEATTTLTRADPWLGVNTLVGAFAFGQEFSGRL